MTEDQGLRELSGTDGELVELLAQMANLHVDPGAGVAGQRADPLFIEADRLQIPLTVKWVETGQGDRRRTTYVVRHRRWARKHLVDVHHL